MSKVAVKLKHKKKIQDNLVVINEKDQEKIQNSLNRLNHKMNIVDSIR